MIKIPKKQLYRLFKLLTALFLLFYIYLPVYLTRQNHLTFKSLLIFYAINIGMAVFLFNKVNYKKSHLQHQIEDLEEKINVLNDEGVREIKNNSALEEKIRRYDNLKNIIEEINQNLSLESIADSLVNIAFSTVAGNKGVCVLYLLDNQTMLSLNLFKAKKEDQRLVIKSKEGDIFDLWVLRHNSPLLIEDIKKDFRFDLEKLKAENETRTVSSLISSPLISERKFIGVLRLDYPKEYFYSQDDLRFLVAICDLGAVALENGELFKKTQDLAIHDELTTLYTKGYFLERLKEESKRSLRQGRNLSLLMLDIDYFKNYNDKFGHTAGDIVLKVLANKIVSVLKDLEPAVIGRFGGEEFCIILPDLNKKETHAIAEKIRSEIEKTKIILRRQETNVTVSIGIANLPLDTPDENELIIKADRAMYEAKQKGRNRVC